MVAVAGRMRLFTLEEANALIPKLEMLMERMQQRGLALRRALEDLTIEFERPAGDLEWGEVLAGHPELRTMAQEIEELTAEIEACGVQFKGLDLGLVDFPAEIEGQIGLLCWQFGEKEITHWHSLEGGFAARQRLPQVARRSYLQ